MGFADYGRLVRRWGWLLLVCPLVAALAAGAISREISPLYEANATVLVKPAQPLNDPGQTNAGVSSTADQVAATYAQLMTQPSLLGQVSSDLHLGWSTETLAAKVKVTPQPNTTVIRVAVQDTNPERASAIANKLVQDFASTQNQLNQKQFAPSTTNLQSQAQQLQKSISSDQDRINQLSAQAAAGRLNIQDQSSLESQQQQLVRDQALYQDVSLRLAQLRTQATVSSDSVLVISLASVPSSPVSPKPLLNVLLAAAAGLVLAVAVLAVVHRLDQTVKDDEELQRRTGLTTMGHIPFAPAAKTAMGELVVLGGRSSASEAYRGLRTNLLFAAVDHRVKTITVTSPAPRDGKSRTAANLGIVLAAAGHLVLLVDADFRQPSLHGYFGRASKPGLSELILNDAGDDEELIHEISEVPNLWLLAAGSRPPNPSELLGSTRVDALLAELASRFHYVVLDTPPLNAVTDPTLIATHTDGTLLVIEHGKTTLGSLTHAKSQLEHVGAPLLGVVANKLRATGGKYGYPAYGYYASRRRLPVNGPKVATNVKGTRPPSRTQ
jgi:non-specific protein-tyrosine kinase